MTQPFSTPTSRERPSKLVLITLFSLRAAASSPPSLPLSPRSFQQRKKSTSFWEQRALMRCSTDLAPAFSSPLSPLSDLSSRRQTEGETWQGQHFYFLKAAHDLGGGKPKKRNVAARARVKTDA